MSSEEDDWDDVYMHEASNDDAAASAAAAPAAVGKRTHSMMEHDDEESSTRAITTSDYDRMVALLPQTPCLDTHADHMMDLTTADIPRGDLIECLEEIEDRYIRFPARVVDRTTLAFALFGFRPYQLDDQGQPQYFVYQREHVELEYRKLHSPLQALRIRCAHEGLLPERSDSRSEFQIRIHRIFEQIGALRDLLLTTIRSRIYSDLTNDLPRAEEIVLDRLRPDDEDLTVFMRLLKHLLNRAFLNGYRKKGRSMFRQIVLNNRINTRAWEYAMTLTEFVYSQCRKDDGEDSMWKALTTKSGNASSAATYLENCHDVELPVLDMQRHLFAFRNGVYNADTCEFLQHGRDLIPVDWVASKFIDQKIPRSVVNRIESFYGWRDIATPALDQIFLTQRHHLKIRARTQKGTLKLKGDLVTVRNADWAECYWGEVMTIRRKEHLETEEEEAADETKQSSKKKQHIPLSQRDDVSVHDTFDIKLQVRRGNTIVVRTRDNPNAPAVNVQLGPVVARTKGDKETLQFFFCEVYAHDVAEDTDSSRSNESRSQTSAVRLAALTDLVSHIDGFSQTPAPGTFVLYPDPMAPPGSVVYNSGVVLEHPAGDARQVWVQGVKEYRKASWIQENDEGSDDEEEEDDEDDDDAMDRFPARLFAVADLRRTDIFWEVADWEDMDHRRGQLRYVEVGHETEAARVVFAFERTANRTMAYDVPYRNIRGHAMDWDLCLIGRMLHELNKHDFWQVIPFYIGKAGTGKSCTLQNVVAQFYDSTDVGVVSASSDPKWIWSTLEKKKVWIFPEVRRDTKINQGQFQSAVSGEPMAVEQKFQDPYSVTWKTPGMLAGNETASWCDAAGSLDRRMIWTPFDVTVPDNLKDMGLDARLKKELPSIIVKANMCYREFAYQFSHRSIWDVIPRFFKETSARLRKETQPLQAFIDDAENLLFGPDLYVLFSEFVKAFREYYTSNFGGKKQLLFNEALYATTFEKSGLIVEDTRSSSSAEPRQWPPLLGAPRDGKFILGVGLRVHYPDYDEQVAELMVAEPDE